MHVGKYISECTELEKGWAASLLSTGTCNFCCHLCENLLLSAHAGLINLSWSKRASGALRTITKKDLFWLKKDSFKQLTLLWVQGNVSWFFKHLTLQKPLKVCFRKRIFDKRHRTFLAGCICRLWLVFEPGGSLGASVQQRPHWLGPCPFRQGCTQTRLFLACSLATVACFCKAVTCLLMSTGRRLQSLAAYCWVFKNWFWMPKFLFEEEAFVALLSRRHAEAQQANCLYVRQMHLCLQIIAFLGCMLCNLTFIRELDGGILLKTG